MAIKKCSECGREVSTKADKCPNCGAPIKRKGCGCLFAAIAVVFVLFVLFIISLDGASRRDTGPVSDVNVNSPPSLADAQAAAAQRKKEAQANDQAFASNAAKAASEADAARKLRDAAPTYPVDQIVRYYAGNEVAGDNDFKGRVFKISGTVDSVGKDILGSSYVILKGSDRSQFRSAQCFFDDAHLNELATLSPGQQVVIFGRCDGLMMNVLMKDCELINH